MVITEPVPELLEEIGWTGGEAIADCLERCSTTSERREMDGSHRLGRRPDGVRWLAYLHVWTSTPEPSPPREPTCSRCSHSCERNRSPMPGAARSTSRRPTCRSSGAGTGSPRLRLYRERRRPVVPRRRDPGPPRARPPRRLTGLAIVEPDRKLMPPEPLRWAGGSVIRAALVRRDLAFDRGGRPRCVDRVRRLAASAPRSPAAFADAGVARPARAARPAAARGGCDGARRASIRSTCSSACWGHLGITQLEVDGRERGEEIRRQPRFLLGGRDFLHLGDIAARLGGNALEEPGGVVDEIRVVPPQVVDDDSRTPFARAARSA